jgi:nucleoside-diphosphate kinase
MLVPPGSGARLEAGWGARYKPGAEAKFSPETRVRDLGRAARSFHRQTGRTMATERTFSILKPDATRRNLTGAVNAVIEEAGLRIVGQRRIRMTKAQAEKFYEVHKERPFFGELVTFMTSGPVVVQVLEGENAVAKYREVMGATNPAQAAEGTIRKKFAESVGENTVHGSDSAENAKIEIAQFFQDSDIVA